MDIWKEVHGGEKKSVLINETGHFFLIPMKYDQEAYRSLS